MNEIIKQDTQVAFSQEDVETIKNTVAKDATDSELKLFIMQCKRTGLDPFSRQIYFLKMGGKASIQSSIDGFRLIAERSGKYQGQTLPVYLDKDGKWHEVWTLAGYPVACKVGVHRSDFKEALYAIAKWDSYAPVYNGQVGTMWKKMPDLMLSKVAEALALRKAFPNDLSGLYSSDEMAQAKATTEYDQTPIDDDFVPVVVVDDHEKEPVIEMEDVTPKEPEPEVVEPVVMTDIQKNNYKWSIIKKLLDDIVIAPLETKEEYAEYILENLKMKATPSKFDKIIEELRKMK